jgi:hypothetical protein
VVVKFEQDLPAPPKSAPPRCAVLTVCPSGQAPRESHTAFDAVQRIIELTEGAEPTRWEDPAAVALGRRGLKGGPARAASLSPSKRKQIAKRAAAARGAPRIRGPQRAFGIGGEAGTVIVSHDVYCSRGSTTRFK